MRGWGGLLLGQKVGMTGVGSEKLSLKDYRGRYKESKVGEE